MPDLITDEDLVNTVYKWNLLFFEGRMIATNEPFERKKYNYLIKHEADIKEKAYYFLNYWKDFKHSLYGNAVDYVTDNLRDFMENFNPPTKKKDNSRYNKTPIQY